MIKYYKKLALFAAALSMPLAAADPLFSISATASAAAQAQKPQPARPAGQQQAAPQGKIQLPPPEAMIILIRAHLVALSQANQTNNYTVLNGLGSASFKKANTPQRLAEIFEPFRTNKIDLAPVVFITPQLSRQPEIIDGRMRLTGFFPTQPMRVDYDLMFEPSDGIWRLFAISVNLTRTQQGPAQAPTR